MGFVNFYSWLKYASLPTSFVFKNRLFLEKSFRSNNVYPFLGETHKSFSWTLLSSSNTSLYWISFSYLRLALVLFLLFVPIYLYLNTGWSLSSHPVFYFIWRFLDLIYLFIVQLQYVFLTVTVYSIFALSNFVASTNFSFIRWMRKNHAEVLITSNSDDKLRPIDILVPESSDIISQLKVVNSASNPGAYTTYYLFYKYLYNLAPYTSSISVLDKSNLKLCANSSGRKSVDFSLENLLSNCSLSALNLDFFNSNFFNNIALYQLSENILKFNRITRWLSLYSTSPIRFSLYSGADNFNLTSQNFNLGRELLQQQFLYPLKQPKQSSLASFKESSNLINLNSLSAPTLVYSLGLNAACTQNIVGGFVTSNLSNLTSQKNAHTAITKYFLWFSSQLNFKAPRINLCRHFARSNNFIIFSPRGGSFRRWI